MHVHLTSERARPDWPALAANIKSWGRALGFQHIGIADVDLAAAEPGLRQWLAAGWHGDMDYMARHGSKRSRPAELVPGTLRVISARLDYQGPNTARSENILADPGKAFISRYALGRDYHKVVRGKLRRLAGRLERAAGCARYRVFSDSAPVMEVELASRAGLGWRGKHTLLLSRESGSFFFLGEIYTDLPLPIDRALQNHCGSCRKCLDVCPTQAIVAPYKLDARRCISYLTIEHRGSIPVEFRKLIGNRVYGCDDCQLVCPWNRYARSSGEPDFAIRHGLDDVALVELFGWSEAEFDKRLAGSAIRRIGFERWLRNLAIGLGNAPTTHAICAALLVRRDDPSRLVREHVAWALDQHGID
ncbi:MAG: tRNA epoxyqueuosine(34) reductase QueG [Burkholderiales bacterium]